MFEAVQKAIFASIGAGFLAKEKVEELGKKVLAEAKVGEVEGKKFLEELRKKSEDARIAMEKAVNDAATATYKKLDLVQRKELTKLEARIAELEAALKRKG